MKISKTKLRQIIKEELGTLREEDPAEETALNSPRQAGREWSYENLANTVGDLVREALEGHGLDADSIRDAIAEALDEELGPVEEELEEGWKEFAQGAKDLGRDVSKLRKPGTSKKIRQDATAAGIAYDAQTAADDARYAKTAARRQSDEKARSQRRDADYRARSRDLEGFTQSQKDQRRRAQKKKEDDRRHSGFGSDHYVEQE